MVIVLKVSVFLVDTNWLRTSGLLGLDPRKRSSGRSGGKLYRIPSKGMIRANQQSMFRYKILFLDVLFPLSLDKIIFVDAGARLLLEGR
jgi:hypothetical protein